MIRRISLIVFAALLAGWLHWPSLHNGFVTWDDLEYLRPVKDHGGLSPALVRWAFTAIRPFYYHPLTWLSHALDFSLWGFWPAGHHAASVVLHAVNTGLVAMLTWRMLGFGNGSPNERAVVTALVAGVFGAHPLTVESVAWLAERKTLLCATFCLASVAAYLRRAWWTCQALAVAALLSKPMAVPLPVVLLVLDDFPLQRARTAPWSKLVAEKLPLLGLSLVTGLLTIVSQREGGAVTPLLRFDLVERYVVATRNLLFYLWKMIWPAWLSPYYPLEGAIPIADAEFLLPAVVVPLLIAGVWWARRWTRLPSSGWWTYALLVLPVSGLMQAGAQGAADRFAYLPMVPVLIALAVGGLALARRLGNLGRLALVVLLGCYAAFLGFQTRAQIPVWRDDETLWRSAHRYFPNSVLINWKLALALAGQEKYAAALEWAERAGHLSGGEPRILGTLGWVYLRNGRSREAAQALEDAAARSEATARVRYHLACAYAQLGQPESALENLRGALDREPSYATSAATDPDLAALRADPRFGQLVGQEF